MASKTQNRFVLLIKLAKTLKRYKTLQRLDRRIHLAPAQGVVANQGKRSQRSLELAREISGRGSRYGKFTLNDPARIATRHVTVTHAAATSAVAASNCRTMQ